MTNEVPQYFALLAVVAAALASVAVWSPRRTAVRAGALALAALFLPTAWLALGDLMSRPKPVAFEWWQREAEAATVLAAQLREGDGVYLWLQLDGTLEPRAYRLPWDRQLAEQLEKAQAEAQRNGTGLRHAPAVRAQLRQARAQVLRAAAAGDARQALRRRAGGEGVRAAGDGHVKRALPAGGTGC